MPDDTKLLPELTLTYLIKFNLNSSKGSFAIDLPGINHKIKSELLIKIIIQISPDQWVDISIESITNVKPSAFMLMRKLSSACSVCMAESLETVL